MGTLKYYKMVDVVITLYSKPWQTLCTLKSLMLHSRKHIDKIYFCIEPKKVDKSVEWIADHFDNMIVYKMDHFFRFDYIDNLDFNNESVRHSVEYQYAIEKSDKKYIFITHNDVLYQEDIIGEMLNKVGETSGIGLIGQCWNCPCFHAGVCDHDKFGEYNPTWGEVYSLLMKYGAPRMRHIDKKHPMPLMECRLNEFACIIDREKCLNNGFPYFGIKGVDNGERWFRDMVLKGHKFTNYNISLSCHHGFWANGCGNSAGSNKPEAYIKAENAAKEYFENNFI